MDLPPCRTSVALFICFAFSFLSITNGFITSRPLSVHTSTMRCPPHPFDARAIRICRELLVSSDSNSETTSRRRIRERVRQIAKRVVTRPFAVAQAMPGDAIAQVIKESTFQAVDEVIHRDYGVKRANVTGIDDTDLDALIEEAFAPVEKSLDNMEKSLREARMSLKLAKGQAKEAVGAVQAAAVEQLEGAADAVKVAEEVASRKAVAEVYATVNHVDVNTIDYDDIDFATSQMAPPFLDDEQCLVPGEPIVRVENAPENSRRIFAGIDIMASVDTVWEVLTDYENLHNVVPNLEVNEVKARYEGRPVSEIVIDDTKQELEQCRQMADQLRGGVLRQVGKATVAGLKFSARTTLEVREWPQGLPDFAHFYDEMWDGRSRQDRAQNYAKIKLQRYAFPRPFAISKLPTRDITMQSLEDDDGEFRLYQGVWRLQPLPGCTPDNQDAMRLTYAVEVSPRSFLPVQLIEGRIAKDLCSNLVAIRDYVTNMKEKAR